MFTAKDFEVARAIKPGINLARLDPSAYAWLKIAQNANSGSTVYDADITNGIATFDGVTVSKPLVSLKLNIPVTQTGSGTPSPDNIRDFIGFSGVGLKVSRHSTVIETLNGLYVDANGIVTQSASQYPYRDIIAKVKQGETYTYSVNGIAVFIPVMAFFDKYPVIGTQSYNNSRLIDQNTTFIAPINGYVFIRGSGDFNEVNQMVATGTNTDYEQGNTYAISFGQTVYSAILDVLTGKLSITHSIVDLGDLTWRYGSGSQVFYTEDITDMSEAIPFDNMACSAFETLNSNISLVNMTNYSIKRGKSESSMGTIYVKDTDYTDADDFKTAVTGMKLVYELAEPIEIQLTPTVINTLIGENVIFADVANVTECKYTRK